MERGKGVMGRLERGREMRMGDGEEQGDEDDRWRGCCYYS